MKRFGVFAGLMLMVFASFLFARQGVVKTHNGQTYEGEIDEKDPTAVTVVTHGISTRLDRSSIASITYADASQGLAQQLAKLGPKDVASRLAIARQAMTAQEYAVARNAAEQVLAIDPNNAEAVALESTIESQMRMERNSQKPAEEAPPSTAKTTTRPVDQRTLRPSEINAIRQAEMRPDDAGVRVRFEHNVQHRFVDFLGKDHAGSFYSLNPMQQAQRILRDGPPEMREDVIIVNDPPALLQYRRVIQPFVVLNCATAACHGGNQSATSFQLLIPPDSDAATYTNFYILTRYSQPSRQSSDGVFGNGLVKMIDRQHPQHSLLLEYALPGSMAEFQHPEVTNFRPPLRGTSDARYRQMLDWIGSTLVAVEPDYGFDFKTPATQPGAAASSAPSTQAGRAAGATARRRRTHALKPCSIRRAVDNPHGIWLVFAYLMAGTRQ